MPNRSIHQPLIYTLWGMEPRSETIQVMGNSYNVIAYRYDGCDIHSYLHIGDDGRLGLLVSQYADGDPNKYSMHYKLIAIPDGVVE